MKTIYNIGDKIEVRDDYGIIENMCGIVVGFYGDGTFEEGLAIKTFHDNKIYSNADYLKRVKDHYKL